jgi:hypothetical protein
LKIMFSHHQEMNKNVGKPELFKLAQRRHLIVHRRGSVDAGYLQKTGDNYQVGDTLKLTSEYIYQAIYLVRDVGISILDAVATSPELTGVAPPTPSLELRLVVKIKRFSPPKTRARLSRQRFWGLDMLDSHH